MDETAHGRNIVVGQTVIELSVIAEYRIDHDTGVRQKRYFLFNIRGNKFHLCGAAEIAAIDPVEMLV